MLGRKPGWEKRQEEQRRQQKLREEQAKRELISTPPAYIAQLEQQLVSETQARRRAEEAYRAERGQPMSYGLAEGASLGNYFTARPLVVSTGDTLPGTLGGAWRVANIPGTTIPWPTGNYTFLQEEPAIDPHSLPEDDYNT